MNKFLFFVIIFILFGLIIALNMIDKLFKNKPNYIIIQIFTLGLFINIGLYFFIYFYYSHSNLVEGPPGPKGQPGIKGPKGEPDSCVQCEPVKQNLGERKLELDRKTKLIVEIPKIPANLPGRPA